MYSQLFINQLYSALNSTSNLNPEDFSINQYEDEYFTKTIKISYRYNQAFYFILKTYKSDPDKFDCEVSPGGTFETEDKGIEKSNLYKEIRSWNESIYNTLKNSLEFRKIEENEKKINELEGKLQEAIGDVNEEFNQSEISELRSMLDEMRDELSSRLEEEEKRSEEIQLTYNQLFNEFEKLKAQVGMLDKKNWLLSFYTKTYLWSQDNPNLITRSLLEIGYKFLPEPVQQSISSETMVSTLETLLPKQKETTKK